jgi:hypothetical protein
MTDDEYKGVLTLVSAATLHAILSNEKTSLHGASKMVPIAVNIAEQLLEEIDRLVEDD